MTAPYLDLSQFQARPAQTFALSTLKPFPPFLILYFLFLSSSGSNKYRNQGFSLLAGEERQKSGISEFPTVNNSPL